MADHKFGFRTRALHAGAVPDAVHGSRAVPIYQTTSFVFETQQDAADLFALQKYGNINSRISTPPFRPSEERLPSLEGGSAPAAPPPGRPAESAPFQPRPDRGITMLPRRNPTGARSRSRN